MNKGKTMITAILAGVLLTGCIGNPYDEGIKSLEEGEYSKAAAEFQKAIEKEKNLADSYRGLGISLWEEQDYAGAHEAFCQALAEGTEASASIYSLMGNCQMQMNEYEQASAYYEQALSMEDISSELKKEISYNLIAAYEYAGNIEKAKEKVAAYLEEYPDDEEVLKEAAFLETR